MKKIILGGVIGLVVLIVLAVIAVGLFLDKGIKKGIETVGPMLTKVEIKLDSVSLSILSGSGKIKGLVVGNPEGYKTPSAIQVGSASLAVQPGSLLADKVVVKSIDLQNPEITFEQDLKGNNLSKILANLEAATAGGTNEPAQTEPAATRKLQVDDFRIIGGKINVSLTALANKSATVPLPEIHLTGLGTGPEGITSAELTKVALREIEKAAVKAAASAVSKQAEGLANEAGKAAVEAGKNATKGITDLFKKK